MSISNVKFLMYRLLAFSLPLLFPLPSDPAWVDEDFVPPDKLALKELPVTVDTRLRCELCTLKLWRNRVSLLVA